MLDFCPCTGSAICKVNAVVKLLPTSQVRTESLKIAKKKLKKKEKRQTEKFLPSPIHRTAALLKKDRNEDKTAALCWGKVVALSFPLLPFQHLDKPWECSRNSLRWKYFALFFFVFLRTVYFYRSRISKFRNNKLSTKFNAFEIGIRAKQFTLNFHYSFYQSLKGPTAFSIIAIAAVLFPHPFFPTQHFWKSSDYSFPKLVPLTRNFILINHWKY